jgi:penicillin-binding protein 1C
VNEPHTPSTSPHSSSKTGVNALMVGEVVSRSEAGGGLAASAELGGGTPSLALPHRWGGDAPSSWRRLRIAALTVAAAGVVCTATFAFWVHSLGPVPLGETLEFSTVVVDRNGRLLRPYATLDGRWRLPATVKDVDPRYLDLLVAYEDKRFRSHYGVDPIAVARAALQLVKNGRIVSGGSTLTMQVARLLEPRTDRTFVAKLRQAVRAIQLERVLSKDEILTLYLGLAPYGGNLEGTRAAALAYFGKEPRRLSLGEAALLVAIPQSPELRRPDRSAQAAHRARDRVLDRVIRLPADEVEQAKAEPSPAARRAMPVLAPHAADQAVVSAAGAKVIALTIDASIQQGLEELARERARALGPDVSVAIVAVDNATGEVLARVAAADYFDERRAGQVDMTQAVRSPGSTLKPFIYGLGFEDGLIHPETLIEDRPVRYGSYAPENFDLTFQGTVSVRKALQLSLNVPAVAVLQAIHANRLTARITDAGARFVLPPGEVPGLAMGLGGVGVSLSDLTMLYAGLARGGNTLALTERRDSIAPPAQRRLLDSVAAWYVGNVMIGTPPPENAAGGRIAFKTGTSYGYRDAWTVGFDGKRTVGVWVGRPDGAPVPGLVGRTAAAPILFDAFARLGSLPAALPKAPKGVIAAANNRLPLPLQRFRPGSLVSDNANPAPRITFPPNGARLAAEGSDMALKISGGVQPLTLLVNGVPRPTQAGQRTLFFTPDGPGFARLTIMDARGVADSVVVRIE